MKRRDFIKISTVSIIPLLTSCRRDTDTRYEIEVASDMPVGHLVFTRQDFKKGAPQAHDILIVGGGIAGLAAACSLGDKDFILCELSDEAGGTSGSISINGNRYAQGAHYDLAYPDNFGHETLELLENMNIIGYNTFTGLWEFNDKQFIIDPISESRCFSDGSFRNDVIPDTAARDIFQQMLEPYKSVMKMPTRLIENPYRPLNNVSFAEFMNGKLQAGPEFRRAIDYNMTDDYGGTASEVSALAGIHYYQCRPYFYQPVELFSPPQGNYYFIDKMLRTLPPGNLKTRHLVRRIIPADHGFDVEVIDVGSDELILMKVKKIIYAGQKHALKFIYPDDHGLFSRNTYAPWIVMNFVIENLDEEHPFWQNEIIKDNTSMMGFVDSAAQYHRGNDPHIITAYYCFKPSQRQILANIDKNKNRIVEQTVRYISEYFEKDISRKIRKVFIKVLGHAMPVPAPGFLFDDKNELRANKNIIYAGVDNSRLPLLFEALDSGIYAAGLLKEL